MLAAHRPTRKATLPRGRACRGSRGIVSRDVNARPAVNLGAFVRGREPSPERVLRDRAGDHELA